MQAKNSSQIPWSVGFLVVQRILGKEKQRDLAELFGVSDSAINCAKREGVFRQKWAKAIEIIQKKSWQELVLEAGAEQVPPSSAYIGINARVVQTGVINGTTHAGNVAAPLPGGDIARELCELIVEHLEGRDMDTQIAIRARVKAALEGSGEVKGVRDP